MNCINLRITKRSLKSFLISSILIFSSVTNSFAQSVCPTADAGGNKSICEVSTFSPTGIANNADSVKWESNGTGSFVNSKTSTPTYTPSAADISAGNIILTFYAYPDTSVCSNFDPVTSQMTLTIVKEPIVTVGSSSNLCTNSTFTLSGNVLNSTNYQWETNGGGFFNNPTSLNAIYTPAESDLVDGAVVTLTLVAQPESPCTTSPVSASLNLTMFAAPTSDAGSDVTICQGDTYTVTDASAEYQASVGWFVSSGSGTLSEGNTLAPTYTPSANDISVGYAELTLYAYGTGPCSSNSPGSTMRITITPAPTVDAGIAAEICETNSYSITDATANNYSAVAWTGGDGTFSDPSSLSTNYTPGSGDIAAGSVTLTLTATGSGVCTQTVSDTKVLTISKNPTINALSPQSICDTESLTITATATNYNSLAWTSSGTGTFTFPNALTTEYIPSPGDISDGVPIILTLTTTATAPCVNTASRNMSLTIDPSPTANAGPDDDFCTSEANYQLVGQATDYSAISWSGGSGTFANGSTLTPTYTPGAADFIVGSVTLTMTVTGTGACSNPVSDQVILTFIDEPTANAGSGGTICSGSSFNLSGTATNHSGLSWTGGDGTFLNGTTTTPTYTPGTNDIANGTVTLTLTAAAISPCANDAQDAVVITIQPAPIVSVGNDLSSCGTTPITLTAATASNYSSLLWESTGSGTFSDPGTLNPVYTPSATDLSTGLITLTLTADPTSPCAASASESLILTLNDEPTGFAGNDASICEGDTYTITDGTATNYSAISWASSGNGSFTNGDTPNPTYVPGSTDIGEVTLTMTVVGISPCNTTITDDIVLTVDAAPTVNAGASSSICEGNTYTTSGAVTNASVFEWSSSGTGSFTNPGDLITTYTPTASDITNGTVSLTLTAWGNGECTTSPITSTIVIDIINNPTANAGADQTICEGAYVVTNAAVTNASSIVWTTSGDGSFVDNTVQNPIYTPGLTDIGASVVLTVNALPNSPCAATATDDVILTVTEAATVYAGLNAEICESTLTYTLSSATGTGAQDYQWTSSGSGNFIDDTQINAIYQPSVADIANGGVTLTLTGFNPPCVSETSSMRLDIYREPIADAGVNATICVNSTYALVTADATDYSALLWETSGSGVFDDPTLRRPTYIPSASDYLLPSVTLTLTATAISPCGGSASSADFMILEFVKNPLAEAGAGGTICETETFEITDATASNYSDVSWSGGDGTWTGQNTLLPIYTPGPGDITQGSVTLTLTVNPNSPCINAAIDNTTLTIQPRPTVSAGNDETICEGSNISLSTASASDYASLFWTSTGTGVFDDQTNLNPIYTPTSADIAEGSITLKLTAASNSPCGGIEESTMVLTILKDPTADAGSDATICEDGDYFISDASVTGESNIVWTSPTNGSFNNPTIIDPVYTPSAADIANGSVILTLSATGTAPCMGFASDQMIITIDPLPIVDAGTNSSICSGDYFTTSTATVTNHSSVVWTTSGTGAFANNSQIVTTYTPSAQDIAAGTVTLRLTARGTGACDSYIYDEVILTIAEPPTAYAGNELDICEDGITIITAEATQFSTLLWTSSGSTGTLLNANTLFPTYTPSASDIAASSVTLTLTAYSNSPCPDDATSDVIVNITADPTVYAGVNATICETETYTINSATASEYSSLLWTSIGDGTFLNEETLTPTYIPGPNDIAAGSATLTLTANAILPCSNTPSSQMVLTIQPLASVEAGTSTTICSGETHTTIDATATDYTSLLWTTSGSGTFGDNSAINTIYTPSSADLANGSAILILSAENNTPCSGYQRDSITLLFQDLPTADAGSDATICESESFTVSDASANNYSAILWTSSGNGLFTNETSLTPTYVPGSADIESGSAILTMTTTGMAPCFSTAEDQITLTVSPMPTVDAGSDGSVCEGETFTVSDATASDYLSYTWTTSGSGSFTNGNTLTPTYTPDAADVALGSVNLRLTATANSPCSGEVYAEMTLTVEAIPVVDASDDHIICDTEEVNITSATATDYASLLWSSTGTGIFSDAATLNPTYTPSAADITAGTVTLRLTAISNNPCSSNSFDETVVTIEATPIAYAGADVDICEGTTYTFADATASNYVGVAWSSTGTGTLIGANTLTPSYSPSSADLVAGSVTLTLTATNSSYCSTTTDQVILTIIPNPTVNVGSDAIACEDVNYQIVGVTATDYSALNWTSDGTGNFSNPNILLPEYNPSAADLASGSVILKLTASANSPCTNSSSDSLRLTFQESATAYAGSDESICFGENITISTATATNYASLNWTSSGTGSFTSGSTLTPTYTPSFQDISDGSVTLTLEVTGIAPCGDITDVMVLTIQPSPSANTGSNASICEDQTFTVSTATASNYDELNWTTNGSGNIINGNTLTPTYEPSSTDITNGIVTLTLEATSLTPCTGSDVSSMNLSFILQPTVDAGVDATICEDNTYTNTDATASNYASLNWSTNGTGTGTFSDASSLQPTYNPSAADFVNGTVTLTLTAVSNSPCVGDATDVVVLTLVPKPIINAGDDATICETEALTISTATASLYNNLYWTSDGTGTFSGGTSLTPTYTPSAADIAAGVVTLALNAEGEAPCLALVNDEITVNIISEAVINAGADAELCSGRSYTITDATAINHASLAWSTSGSGTFINPNSISPNYLPSVADYAAGSVDLTLTAESNAPCASTKTDVMTITLYNSPVVNAGVDDGICEDETYTLVNATASDYSTIKWTTDGDGTFSNDGSLNPVYSPGSTDITSGNVTLTLSAESNAPCVGTETDYMVLTISPLPIANAGPNLNICEGSFTLTTATALNYSTINWTSSGTGTLSNETSLTPIYTPSSADIANGSVDLTMTIDGNGNCTATDTDIVTLNLFQLAEVFAGNDGTICENGSFNITSSTASQYSTVKWTTSGDGTFSLSGNTILTVYTPGSADIANGSVTLTLTANSQTPCATPISDDVVLSIDALPTVFAGSDETFCEGPFTVSDASASDYNSLSWSSSGTGIVTNASTLTPSYTPSAADSLNGSVTLTLVATSSGACNSLVQDTKVISFTKAVSIDAGSDADICQGTIYTVTDATVSNNSAISWSSSGNGTFADINTISPTYTPSVDDILAGSVILTATATGIAPCGGSETSDMVLTIHPSPTVFAGADAHIDAGDVYIVNDAASTAYTTLYWESNGTGTFSNDATLISTYTPSAADIVAGQVTLTLYATGIAPCSNTINDQLILTIGALPTINAGPDEEVCEDGLFTVTGSSATNNSEILWTTSGTGLLTNETTLNPTYDPSANDITIGSVVLTATVTANPPSTTTATDNMILSFHDLPEVSAGSDESICDNDNFVISSSSASGYSDIYWTTSGMGTFSNPNEISTIYIPHPNDASNGSVVLTLHAVSQSPCTSEVTDDLTLSFLPTAKVYAGVDATICAGGSLTINTATATDCSVLNWVASGSGSLIDNGTLYPTYNPDATDIANGSVTLTLTGTGIAPCETPTSIDQMTLYISSSPTVEAGADTSLCNSSDIDLINAIANNYTSLSWTSSSGSGTFSSSNVLNPRYSFSTDDITNGSVTLTLTVIGDANCPGVYTDEIVVSINGDPTAEAGDNASICDGDNYTISTANATDYSALLWTTSGDGTILNSTGLTPTYIPSSNDILNGSVIMTLTSTALSPCTSTASDQMLITIGGGISAYAGTDDSICEGMNYTIFDATTSNAVSYTWNHSGAGTLNNTNTLNPTYIPDASDYVTGTITFTLTANGGAPCNASIQDAMVLSLFSNPTISTATTATICESDAYSISATATNYQSTLWTSSGDGIFDDATMLNATYTPGTNDISNGNTILTLTANPIAPCAANATADLTLTIQGSPSVDAGTDAIICEDNPLTLSGSANNQQSVLWRTLGDGTFDNTSLLTATYTAGTADISNGTVDLELKAVATSPCSGDVYDTITLTIEDLPTVSANVDDTICEGGTYTLSGSATNQQSVLWTTPGDGTFDDDSSLSAIYTPGSADISNGSVILNLTAFGISPCESIDEMALTIQQLPTANAGTDVTICEDNTYTLSGSATNQESVVWTTAGDGTFDNENILGATYSPGANDKSNGTVELTLTINSISPCSSNATDEIIITIRELPIANAGSDATICEVNNYTLSGSASNHQTVQWISSGDGNFDDPNILAATYTPGNNDITNGTVNLSLTATNITSCDSTDVMTLTIQPLPTVEAGSSASICESDTYTLSGSATNQQSVLWSSTGDGSFNAPTSLTAIYTPGTNDISTGSVTLTLTALSNSPCVTNITDNLTLTINQSPEVDAGSNPTICAGESFTVSEATSSNTSSIVWTSSGSGTLLNPTSITPTYVPSSGDIAAGSVILTLTGNPIAPCSSADISTLVLTITPLPIVDAGDDAIICENEALLLSTASTSNTSSVNWTHSGNGVLTNINTLTPTYTPSSMDAGSTIILTLSGTSNGGCSVITDQMSIDVIGLPSISAGEDATVCEGNIFTILNATEQNTSARQWNTSGTGAFNNSTLLNPFYSPSAADIANGYVILTVTADPNSPCSGTVTDSMRLDITLLPTIDAGIDQSSCGLVPVSLNSTINNHDPSSIVWTSSGTGDFNFTDIEDPEYTPSAADIADGSVQLTLTVTGISPCSSSVSDFITLSTYNPATVDAGAPNVTICEGAHTLNATVTDASSMQWTTSGDGTFNNSTVEDPIYTPGSNDISNRTVTLTLTASPSNPCPGDVSDDIVLNITSPPVVFAGSDNAICESDASYALSDASITGTGSVAWTSSGTGNFITPNIENPIYIPSDADIASGSVILTLTVSNPTCGNITDEMELTINSNPVVVAGNNLTICDGSAVSITSASSSNATIEWSTNGTGSFIDETLTNPTYNPSASDYATGSVVLTMTGTGTGSCSTPVSDLITVQFTNPPTANAGSNSTICGSSLTSYTFSDGEATASDYSDILWTTSGNGTWINNNTLTPTYNFGSNDLISGSVTLTLTANPNSPCAAPTTSSIILTIEPEPTVDAGANNTICEGVTYNITDATASDYLSVQWTSNGTGLLVNANTLTPNYTPGAADAAVGSVILTLTAQPNSPCASPVSDIVTLTVAGAPTAFAGSDITICEDETYALTQASVSNDVSILWSSSGTGTFTNAAISNPIYIPSAADYAAGSVNLTITVNGDASCAAPPTDVLTLNFTPSPIADAGNNASVCENASYTINSSSASNYTAINWTHDGTGNMSNTGTLTPIYTPSSADLQKGSVTLTMDVTGIGVCGNTSDSMILSIIPEPTVIAGPDASICEGSTYSIINASAQDYNTITWTTSGTGTFSNAAILNPIYTPSAADISAGIVSIKLTATSNSPCGSDIYDSFVLTFVSPTIANAGSNATICSGSSHTLVGTSALNSTSIIWTTSGDGSFMNETTLNPTYTPGINDVLFGNVTLTMTTEGNSPCGGDTDEMTLTIQPLPVIDAGINATICEGSDFTIVAATATDENTLSWVTSGSGTFANGNTISPTYTPSAADIASGSVILTLIATPNSPCVDLVSDIMTLNITSNATADAGPDATICFGDSYPISGASATNYSSLTWSTSGTGTFLGQGTLFPTYYPSIADLSTGPITITLTAEGLLPCTSDSSDLFILSFNEGPTIYAGADSTICETATYTNGDATASNHTSVLWETSGTGSFTNNAILGTTYTPSADDINDGVVTLSLTAFGNSPCPESTDNVTLFITKNPTADVGTISEICAGPNVIVGATATDYSALLWATTGTGNILNETTLSPTYTPSAADISAGSVTITLTAYPIGSCAINATSSAVVTINQPAAVYAGTDGVICQGNSYTLSDDTAANYTSLLWTTSGTGTFADPTISNPTYTPSVDDGILGAVTLTLTGSSSSCADVNDYMVLTVNTLPSVYAGQDTAVCEGNTYTVQDAIINNYTSLSWSHNGAGTLTNATTLSPTYTPAAADLGNTITLTVVADATAPCVDTNSDALQLDVVYQPTANAGNDTTICENESYQIVGASATDANSGTVWTTNGTGSFINAGSLLTEYVPSAADIASGSVILRLTANNGPCVGVTDQMILTFSYLPIVDAGNNATVDIGTDFTISSASASNYASISWSSTGTGSFTGGSTLTPTYTPSATDFANGSVLLTLSAIPNSPCSTPVTDYMILTVTDHPAVDFYWNSSCLDTPTEFHVDSTIVGIDSIATYSWDFGDGNTVFRNSSASVSHTYNTAGTFTVSLTIVDTLGYTNKVWHYVDVNPIPVVNFSYEQPSCSELTTQFYEYAVATSGYITEWIWDFGDGSAPVVVNYPDDPNVQHTYPNSGTNPATSMTYQVSLIVTTSDGCTNAAFMDVTVNPSPIADFTYDIACVNNFTEFNVDVPTVQNGGGSIVSYQWDFGDPTTGINNISDEQNPRHLYTNTGTYNVTLTVENANGCSDTYIGSVVINPPPAVEFSTAATCQGAETAFIVNTTVTQVADVVDWFWEFGDGATSDLQDPTHIYNIGGLYSVILTITDVNGCTNADTLDLTIYSPPVANFNYDQPSCDDTLTYFTDYSDVALGTIVEWVWDFGDGTTPVTMTDNLDISHSYAPVGYQTAYEVKLVVTSSNGCTDSITKLVDVLPPPTALFSYSEACAGSPISFFDESIENSGGNIINWTWDFGDPSTGVNNISTVQNPYHIFSGNDTDSIYLVTLSILTSTGCVSAFTDSVEFTSPPPLEFTYATNCSDSAVEFFIDTVITTNIDSITDYFWEFGDGFTSTEMNPIHDYTIPGTYTVSLTILNVNGCNNTVSHEVEVYASPIALFDFDEPICTGTNIQFYDYSEHNANIISEWIWDFGDGNSDIINSITERNVQHQYDTLGTYEVTLTVINNNGCINTTSRILTTLPNPIAEFTYNTACYGDLTTFEDFSQSNGGADIISWDWSFNDPISGINNSSQQQNPVHQFSEAGDYIVTLFIENATGCIDSISKTISINGASDIDFEVSDACLSSEITFTPITSSSEIASYLWEFGDGIISNEQSPVHQYNVDGTYNVTLTVTDTGGCVNEISHEVSLSALPISLFGISESQCISDTVYFSDYSTSESGYITEWQWDYGDGNVTTIVHPDNPYTSHSYESEGTYTVTLTVTNSNGCSNSSTQEVTILPSPVANFDFESVCLNVSAEFIDLSQANGGGQIISWDWDFDDASSGIDNFSTLQNPSHEFKEVGDHEVTLTISNENGCVSIITRTISISMLPEIDFITVGGTCLEGATQFYIDSTLIDINQIQSVLWEFGDGYSDNSTQTSHVYEVPGTYNITLTIIDLNGCSNTISREVYVDQLPDVKFDTDAPSCESNETQFVDLSSTANFIVKWHWEFGDGRDTTVNWPDDQNVLHAYQTSGTYLARLTITTEDSCMNTFEKEITIIPTPVANFAATSVCIDHPAQFTDLSQENSGGVIVDWNWNFGDEISGINNNSSQQNPVHQYAASGMYEVTLTVFNAEGCQDTYSDSIMVTIPPPLDPFTFDDIICMNTEAQFFMSTNVNLADVQTILWDFGDPTSASNTSSDQNPTHIYETPGEYIVTLILDNNSCGGIVIDTLTVNAVPQARFEFENACIGSPTVFTDLSLYSDSPIVGWKWDFGIENLLSDTSTLQNPVYTYNALGEHLVSLEVTDEVGCSDLLDSVLIEIFPTPTANFSFTEGEMGSIEFTNESADATIYEWNFGDGWISDEVDPVHQYDTTNSLISSTYENLELMLISMNESGCADTAVEYYDLYFKGLFIPTAFSPNNPSEAVRTFKPIGVNLEIFEIEVYSSWGDLIWQSSILDENGRPTESWDGTLNGSELPTGAFVWKAKGVFKDGSIWKGNDLNNTGSGSTSGTVLLIR